MTDKALSVITSGLTMLPYKFHDLEDALKSKDELESRFDVKVPELFRSQRKLDKIKSNGRRHFNAFLALYFSSFNGPRGFDLSRLESDIGAHKSVMERHLGKELLFTIDLLVRAHKELVPKNTGPTGLLRKVV